MFQVIITPATINQYDTITFEDSVVVEAGVKLFFSIYGQGFTDTVRIQKFFESI